MKVVLDANVLVSALQFGGKPRIIFDLIVNKEVTAVITEEISEEVLQTLKRKFHYSQEKLEAIKGIFDLVFEKVSIQNYLEVTRDQKDNHIVAITHAITIDCIVSGDNDLLVLKAYNGVPIVSPADFLKNYQS